MSLHASTRPLLGLHTLSSLRSRAWAWFILSLIISCANDVLIKSLGMGLPGIEVSFLRFFWAALLLLIAAPSQVRASFMQTHHAVHLGRSVFLCAGMAIWTTYLPYVPLSQATIINFTIPLITLVLGRVCLKETVSIRQYQATGLGLLGILLTLHGVSEHMAWPALSLLLGAVCFASCDVFNKVSGRSDALLPTLFYTALYTAILSSPLAFYAWCTPTLKDLGVTLLLGFHANVLFFCLLKAFQTLQLSQVAPLRYLELVLSIGAGFFIFGEWPTIPMLFGGCIVIVGATLALTETESDSQ